MSRERRSEWFSLTARCLLLLPLVVPVLVLPVFLLDLDFLEGRVLNGTLEEKDIVVSDSCLSRKRVRWSGGKRDSGNIMYHSIDIINSVLGQSMTSA